MALGIETTLSNIATFLQTIAPTLSFILVLLGGIVYGLAQTQPAEIRGRWQSTAVGLFIGGLVIVIISGGATLIQETSANLLKSG